MEYGVFHWRSDGVYKRSEAIRIFRRRKSAEDWAVKHFNGGIGVCVHAL